MRKIVLILLAVVIIFSALGTAATVANADGGEGDIDELSLPIESWIKIVWDYIFDTVLSAYGGAFCGSSCG